VFSQHQLRLGRLIISLVNNTELIELITMFNPNYRPRRVILERVPDLGVFFTLSFSQTRFLNIDWSA